MTRLRLLVAAFAAGLGTAIGLALPLPSLTRSPAAPHAKTCVRPGVAASTTSLDGRVRRDA